VVQARETTGESPLATLLLLWWAPAPGGAREGFAVNVKKKIRGSLVLLAAAVALAPAAARAHCDSLDGPVARVAERALAAGKPDLALAWVHADGEAEVREAFARAAAVRKLGPDARALADRWFLETLVRVHRASEGAPYTGLKPAGTDFGPAVRAADEAVATGRGDGIHALLAGEALHGAHERFEKLRRLAPDAEKSVAQGRAYVAAYVDFVHFVEGAHAGKAASHDHGHGHGGAKAAPHHH
jgi:hypothetical protein